MFSILMFKKKFFPKLHPRFKFHFNGFISFGFDLLKSQTITYLHFSRFIRLPRITLSGSTVVPGPASRTYYEVPPYLRTTPELNLPWKFRAELSMAFSTAYHLKPHALILSFLEGRPLVDYVDHHAYALSQSFYQHPRTPVIDVMYTKADVVACRRLYQRNQRPLPKKDTDW